MTPSKLVDKPNRAPMLTIFPAQCIPANVNAAGSGASGSSKQYGTNNVNADDTPIYAVQTMPKNQNFLV